MIDEYLLVVVTVGRISYLGGEKMFPFGLEIVPKHKIFSDKWKGVGLREEETKEYILLPKYVRVLMCNNGDVYLQKKNGEVEKYRLRKIEGKLYLGYKDSRFAYRRGRDVEFFWFTDFDNSLFETEQEREVK